MWSSVAFALMIIMIVAAAFFYVTGPLQGHDTWIDDICRNVRDHYRYDACNHPDSIAIAAGCTIFIYIALKMYRD